MGINDYLKRKAEREAAEKAVREADIELRVQEALRRSEKKEREITGREAPQPNAVGGEKKE